MSKLSEIQEKAKEMKLAVITAQLHRRTINEAEYIKLLDDLEKHCIQIIRLTEEESKF